MAACHRAGCHTTTGLPDDGWLTVRPLVWSAFTDEAVYCCVRCLVVDLTEKHRPPEGQ